MQIIRQRVAAGESFATWRRQCTTVRPSNEIDRGSNATSVVPSAFLIGTMTALSFRDHVMIPNHSNVAELSCSPHLEGPLTLAETWTNRWIVSYWVESSSFQPCFVFLTHCSSEYSQDWCEPLWLPLYLHSVPGRQRGSRNLGVVRFSAAASSAWRFSRAHSSSADRSLILLFRAWSGFMRCHSIFLYDSSFTPAVGSSTFLTGFNPICRGIDDCHAINN
jgi:hypothetical protein